MHPPAKMSFSLLSESLNEAGSFADCAGVVGVFTGGTSTSPPSAAVVAWPDIVTVAGDALGGLEFADSVAE